MDKQLGVHEQSGKNTFKSQKFFANLQNITKADKDKKELKRKAKDSGMAIDKTHNNVSAKRFKM